MTEYHRAAQGWDDAQIEAVYARHLDIPGTQVIVLGDEQVGVLTVLRGPRADVIFRIGLLPSAQGHGVGTFLIRSIQETNGRRGRAVRLSVYKCNPAAKLYRRLGFQVVSETDTDFHMLWQPPPKLPDSQCARGQP
jgi:ribosomal protein S18 acetylase RimI-like enzyme